MNIALIGYGRMGKEVEAQAVGRGHQIACKPHSFADLQACDLSNVDVAIEFSLADGVLENLKFLSGKGVNVALGTTGWYDKLDEAKKIVADGGIGFLWSANFSIGVNLFWKILEQAAKLIDKCPDYDIFGHEIHHKQKKDSPSGTAIKTAQILLDNIKRKDTLFAEKLDRPPEPNELHFSSTRGGSVPGTHSVFFDSPADTIEITHTARGRVGFAIGAVQVAEWLKDKKGYFEMGDFINDIIR